MLHVIFYLEKKELFKSNFLFMFIILTQELINELSQAVQLQKRKLIEQDQVNHGTFEDLLVQLKSEPYRRADAVRRSHRKHLDSNRYSRTLDEMSF